MKRWRLTAGLLAMIGSIANAASPVADYSFQNNLTSSIAGAPALVVVGTGTAYATEVVDGQSQTVFTYPSGSGLSLYPTTTLLTNPGVYTIRLIARHDQTGAGLTWYKKYIDFLNRQYDIGLYDVQGTLQLYSDGGGPDAYIGAGYVDVVMTRDVNGIARGYVNGLLQFVVDDVALGAGVVSHDDTLFFFLDDVQSGNEVAPGAVARITIWNAPLSAQEVAALETDLIFADDFDVSGS